MSYSRFICGLTKAGVQVNRKMLADVAINDAAAFAKLVEVAKAISNIKIKAVSNFRLETAFLFV